MQLVDMGAPLVNRQELNSGGKISNSQKDVAGYFILQAENLANAAVRNSHQHISGWNKDANHEVHETMPLPGM